MIPGGYAPDIMRRSKKLLQLTREIYEADKPVAFICHAGWVPISAGIVRNKRGTSVGAIRDDLVNAGMVWEDSPVVVDGNLISSRTPADLPQFMRAIIRALGRPGRRCPWPSPWRAPGSGCPSATRSAGWTPGSASTRRATSTRSPISPGSPRRSASSRAR